MVFNRNRIFQAAYSIVRKNSANPTLNKPEIACGFGFSHKDNVTGYYVSPLNSSRKKETFLAQPIAEAVSVMTRIITGDFCDIAFYSDPDYSEIYLEFQVPLYCHRMDMIPDHVHTYRVWCKQSSIVFSAFDKNDSLIVSNMDHFHPLNKLLIIFIALLARHMLINPMYAETLKKFASSCNYLDNKETDRKSFVVLNEDFYQANKDMEFSFLYSDPRKMVNMLSLIPCYFTKPQSLSSGQGKAKQRLTFSSDAFTDEQRSLIPSLGKEFALDSALLDFADSIPAGDTRSALFYGPAGTGKTMTCKLLAKQVGLPIMETINCTENLDEFVLGKFIPDGDKIVFKESYVTKAIREGGAVVFEEINFAKPQHIAFLNSLLDDNGFVRLDNGETVKRNPNFRFFATMNVGYFGTRELNQALRNRFNAVIELSELSESAIIRMLVERVPDSRPYIDKMLKVYKSIKGRIKTEELDLVISPRNLENWARLARYEGYELAAEHTIIPIAQNDKDMEKAIRTLIGMYKWS